MALFSNHWVKKFEHQYKELPVTKQTKLIQDLKLLPSDSENIVGAVESSQRMSKKILSMLVNGSEELKEDRILEVLHSIGCGLAASKTEESMCLISAVHKICPYDERKSCIGCEYEIGTKSTVFLMASEVKRMKMLYTKTNDIHEKEKYKALINNSLVPSLNEYLTCIQKQYGEELLAIYERIITEVTNG